MDVCGKCLGGGVVRNRRVRGGRLRSACYQLLYQISIPNFCTELTLPGGGFCLHKILAWPEFGFCLQKLSAMVISKGDDLRQNVNFGYKRLRCRVQNFLKTKDIIEKNECRRLTKNDDFQGCKVRSHGSKLSLRQWFYILKKTSLCASPSRIIFNYNEWNMLILKARICAKISILKRGSTDLQGSTFKFEN